MADFYSRSLVATLIFFTTGVLTTQILYSNSYPPLEGTDWTLGPHALAFLALQAVPLFIARLTYCLVRFHLWQRCTSPDMLLIQAQPASCSTKEVNEATPMLKGDTTAPPRTSLRLITALTTSFQFAIALHFSQLTSPSKVTRFLLLPLNNGFDPSLLFLAVGAIPLLTVLYHFARGSEVPRLGGPWRIPGQGQVDARLVVGAAIFGVGWGMTGICRTFDMHLDLIGLLILTDM